MKILFLANHYLVLFNFRKELINFFIEKGHQVFISCPNHPNIRYFIDKGATFIETNFNRRKINVFDELKLVSFYKKLFHELKPDYILSFTIKPNIFGAIAAKKLKIKFIPNITGLGNSFLGNFILRYFFIQLYKYAFRNIHHIFFQNSSDHSFFCKFKIIQKRTSNTILPGSGVNLKEFDFHKMPMRKRNNFLFSSRIMKQKGIDLYLKAAEEIKKIYPEVKFTVIGFCEEDYSKKLLRMTKMGLIDYKGFQTHVKQFYIESDCLVFPSYYPEGISNVLLEAASIGRPLITTDLPGCKETCIDSYNGFLIRPRSVESLIKAIRRFLELKDETISQMGENSRKLVEKNFSRDKIISEYSRIVEF
jgi:glycosyltransferase involved in cell wall biosynthesis